MKTPQGSEVFIAEQKMIRDEDTECANSQYNLGVSLMEQGRLDEAIEAFKDAIENSGRMFEGYVNLGYIYFKQGDLEMVVDANQKAVQ
ncbi:MAG: tetratricopeptide repeat protein, partial [Deltaproteobacteria bacterium]|nr:tetratricopeptide repeat protein [Deltaproteobacteria bacterium]